ncbi:MAG: AraC family transcriptional regulator [Chitinophagaceae bacterium]|nr:MAG: AraC family transcriptional regulator [Chitinophagaceae bacterium]
MSRRISHIPVLDTISDFFRVYGLGKPLHPEMMCMRLEDQPDERLMHMPLYRVNFFRVIHFTNSNLDFYAGDKLMTVTDNCLCFSYPGKLESWTRKGRLSGYVIYFTASFSGLDISHKNFDIDYPFFNFNSEPILFLTTEDTHVLKRYAEEMINEIYAEAPDKLDMVKKLLMVYLQSVKRIYYKQVNCFTPDITSGKTLYNRFRKELDNYIHKLVVHKKTSMPTVARIAQELHVNPNYLNGIIKSLTGKTASTHIQEKLVLEAKSFLLNTDLQVTEIADKLGFENSPYFNRFFKKNAGFSPLDYRKQFVKA